MGLWYAVHCVRRNRGWQFNPPPNVRGAPGERNSRLIPQDVKIAVTVRDQGKCVQCGAVDDLHFDHKIPWSRGGSNSVNNIQLLCGPCNRRKGADDILVLALRPTGALETGLSFDQIG